MEIFTIYMAENKVDGKRYIGFDSAWPSRKTFHINTKKNSCPKFHRAIKKYGKDAFEWSVLFQGWDREFTSEYVEPLLIVEYNTRESGYNVAAGGKCAKHSAETIQKLSKPKSEETKMKFRGKRPHVIQSGSNNNNAVPIVTPYGTFGSIREASEKLNIAYMNIWCYVNKKSKKTENWSYA